MSSNVKTIAVAAAALLAVAGGVYAFGSSGQDDSAASTVAIQTPETANAPKDDASTASSPPGATAANPKTSNAPAAASASVADPAAAPTPRKLTQADLTPPAPKTEDEKLQKAAEGEYNRF
jgi:hypothetical protein